MENVKKKRHLNFGRLFFVIIATTLICFLFVKLIDVPIMSVKIKGNDILKDMEVLEIAKLDDYPSFLGTFMINIKKNLKKNEYVKDVKVTKGIFSVKLNITENKVLYIDKMTNEKVMLNSKIKDDKLICVPYLINEVPANKINEFKQAMNDIDSDILCQMSEIKYDPNEIDSDRYFVNMNDGNGVYLTVNKFDKINKYNTILENIGKQNGTLYLDYGDYFKAN